MLTEVLVTVSFAVLTVLMGAIFWALSRRSRGPKPVEARKAPTPAAGARLDRLQRARRFAQQQQEQQQQEGPNQAGIAASDIHSSADEPEGLEEVDDDDDGVKEGGKRKGKKYAMKMARKEEAKKIAEQQKTEREEKKALDQKRWEEEEKKREEERALERETEKQIREQREKREKREQEEYEEWKGMISTEVSGSANDDVATLRSRADDIVAALKERRSATLEGLAKEFGGSGGSAKPSDAAELLKDLEKRGKLSGVLDERGIYVHISKEEMTHIAQEIDKMGRLSMKDIMAIANQVLQESDDAQAAAVAAATIEDASSSGVEAQQPIVAQ